MASRLIEMYGFAAPLKRTDASASVRRAFLVEDSRSNIKKLILKAKPLRLPDDVADKVANIFHKLDETHSFPLAKAFVLWAREQGSGHEQRGGAAQDEPFRNEPRQGPALLSPEAMARLRDRDQTMQQFMREVGHSLIDALKAKPNVVPQAINKATSLADVTAIVQKYSKRAVVNDKVLVKLPEGWYWVLLEDCENAREGEEMQHCATDSRGQLVSLRDPQGKPHVTMTYNMGQNTVFQIKGKQNREPEKKYWPAIETFFEQRGCKLKDRYISVELRTILGAHAKKTVVVKGARNSWIEVGDGVIVLVPNGTDPDQAAKAAMATVSLVDSDYSNDIKSLEVNKPMRSGEFLKDLQPLLEKMKTSLDIDALGKTANKLEDDGTTTEAMDAMIASKTVKYRRREIKALGNGNPIILKVQVEGEKSGVKSFFKDSTALLRMSPLAYLRGQEYAEGILVDDLVSPNETPGSAREISEFDGKLLPVLTHANMVYGFEPHCAVDGQPNALKKLLPVSMTDHGPDDCVVLPSEAEKNEGRSLLHRMYL